MSQINRYPSLNQPVESLIGNDGIVVPPIFDGIRWDVFVIGAGHIFTTGDIALGTLTINLDGGIADLYPTDAGIANPIGGVLNIFGGSNINTAAPAIPGNSVIINLNDNVYITGTFTADGDITSTAGDISATLGFLNAGTTVTAGTGITSTTGDIVATAGEVNAGTTMTAGTGITSTLGNIVATAGEVNAGTTMTAGTGITSTTGDIVASAGDISATLGSVQANTFVSAGTYIDAGTTVTAGTGITSTTGNITATAGNVVITAGNLNLPNTNVNGTQGVITFGGSPYLHNYGTDNFFLGYDAGDYTIAMTGQRNHCLGRGSLASLTSGNDNSSLGDASLVALTSGNSNTALGSGALGSLTLGGACIGIGIGSGLSYTVEDSNICINHIGVVADNHTIRIGTPGGLFGQQNTCYIAGIRGVAQATTDAGIVTISSDHQLGSTGSMTDGQILIGSTGLNPVLGTLTPGVGLSVTDGAGAITIDVKGGGIDWTVEAVDLPAVAGHGYLANKVGRLDVSLPAVSAIGDIIRIVNISATPVGWRITQGAGQAIYIGNSDTTAGVAGYIEATAIGDAIELVCFTANTDWIATGAPQGNITIV